MKAGVISKDMVILIKSTWGNQFVKCDHIRTSVVALKIIERENYFSTGLEGIIEISVYIVSHLQRYHFSMISVCTHSAMHPIMPSYYLEQCCRNITSILCN